MKQQAGLAIVVRRSKKLLVREDRHRADAEFVFALEASEKGDVPEAERRYRAALELCPDYPEALVNLSQCLLHRRQFAEAEQYIRKALGLDQHYTLAWYSLGAALEGLGQNLSALAAYRTAILICPRYGDAHFNLASLLFDLKEYGLARSHAKIFIEIARATGVELEWIPRAQAIVESCTPRVSENLGDREVTGVLTIVRSSSDLPD